MTIDKYELLTNKLVGLMESGVNPWKKSWHGNPARNFVSGHIYQGINTLICGIEMLANDWENPYFVGYKQAQQMGWNVISGSKACSIKFGGTATKKDKETGDIEFYNISKWHSVFNVKQIEGEGLSEYIAKLNSAISIQNPDTRIPAVEEFIKLQNSVIVHMGDRAFYSPSTDKIGIPPFECFTSAIAYYATLIHEHIHRTGHEDRLGRDFSGSFGSQKYAFEELVAELGSAFLCNELQIEYELENHASYLQSWITVLKEDKRAFFKAAALGQKACKYMQNAAELKQSLTPAN